MSSKFLASLLILGYLSGCANKDMSKQNVGTVMGAGVGAILGSTIGNGEGKVVATALGATLGGYIGNKIGQSMDKADMIYYQNAMTQSLEYNPTGVQSSWQNPDSGNYGSITPRRTYTVSGQNCREFIQEVYIGGKKQQAYGSACRQNDGSWKIIQ